LNVLNTHYFLNGWYGVLNLWHNLSTKLGHGEACSPFNLNLGTLLSSMNNLEITKLVVMYTSYLLSFFSFFVTTNNLV
jgi:hypothetical protein